jgi:RND family efflux transporter MFP subunit
MPRTLPPAVLLLIAAGCQRGKAPPPAPPPPKVTVSQPLPRKLADYGEYTGYTDAYQRVEIRPQVKGRLLKVHFHEGTEIDKGVLLYEIDPEEYVTARNDAKAALTRAEADQRRAVADKDRADASLRRMTTLRSTGGGSAEEYDKALADAKTTAAAVGQADAMIEQSRARLAAAELDLSRTKIYSPIAGRVSRTLVTEGNLVGYGGEPTQLTVMVDQDPIYVFFEIPERDAVRYEERVKPLRYLAPGAGALGLPVWRPLWSDAMIPVEVGVETEQGFPHRGVINFRDPRFEPGTGTVRLRGILENADRKLSSGMFARVRFPLSDPKEQLLVPQAAVLSDQRGRFVYVVKPDNTVEARTITLGTRLGTLVAANGLRPDDWVIVNGIQKARPSAPVDPERKPLTPPDAAAH